MICLNAGSFSAADRRRKWACCGSTIACKYASGSKQRPSNAPNSSKSARGITKTDSSAGAAGKDGILGQGRVAMLENLGIRACTFTEKPQIDAPNAICLTKIQVKHSLS